MNLSNEIIINKTLFKKNIGASSNYANVAINRLFKNNKIMKITKGAYTTKNSIFVISTNLFTPSYLSFWSCSYFKGYTEQIVNTMQVVTTTKHKKINFEKYEIEFHKFNKKNFFGYEKIKTNDGFIFVATDEKLIIDSLLNEKLLGNFDEIIKIIQNSVINKNQIITYLNKINNKSLNKRVGFLLEKYKGIDLSKEIKFLDNNYIKLSKLKNCNIINKKWRLKT